MELKFVAAKKPQAVNTTVQRRHRLIGRIDQQIQLIENPSCGPLPRASWIWINEEGKYLVPIKYGKHAIELTKGMFAVECQTAEMAVKAFETIRSMVLNGELDAQLAKASIEIRARFKT